jgi:aldose sugar dehydrogenase
MKPIIICLIALLPIITNAQQSDIAQIEKTIGWYFEGWGIGDTTLIGRAMHPTCHLKSYREGKFSDMSRSDYLNRFKLKPKPDSLQTRIVSLDITENIAAAKTEIILGSAIFIDYFNLIKTNEGWFIVDKIAVRKAK